MFTHHIELFLNCSTPYFNFKTHISSFYFLSHECYCILQLITESTHVWDVCFVSDYKYKNIFEDLHWYIFSVCIQVWLWLITEITLFLRYHVSKVQLCHNTRTSSSHQLYSALLIKPRANARTVIFDMLIHTRASCICTPSK